MKKYEIIISDSKTGAEIERLTELSTTKKYLTAKYRARYMFDKDKKKVKINHLFKKAGIQINLLDQINELTNEG